MQMLSESKTPGAQTEQTPVVDTIAQVVDCVAELVVGAVGGTIEAGRNIERSIRRQLAGTRDGVTTPVKPGKRAETRLPRKEGAASVPTAETKSKQEDEPAQDITLDTHLPISPRPGRHPFLNPFDSRFQDTQIDLSYILRGSPASQPTAVEPEAVKKEEPKSEQETPPAPRLTSQRVRPILIDDLLNPQRVGQLLQHYPILPTTNIPQPDERASEPEKKEEPKPETSTEKPTVEPSTQPSASYILPTRRSEYPYPPMPLRHPLPPPPFLTPVERARRDGYVLPPNASPFQPGVRLRDPNGGPFQPNTVTIRDPFGGPFQPNAVTIRDPFGGPQIGAVQIGPPQYGGGR